jgi:hypothetical protein
MAAAIQAIGPERCLLSSDGGDPILPNSVECMRLMAATMEAYGVSREAVHLMAAVNPGRLLGLSAHVSARAA